MIRAAHAGDLMSVEAIVASAYRPYVDRMGREPAPMSVDYEDLLTTTDHVEVLVDGGEVVGVIVLVPMPDHLLIENVAIAPTAQGRGFGRRLLEHAERRAAGLGHRQVRLYTNALMTENLSVYTRFGYSETGRHREDGFDRVFMTKELAGAGPSAGGATEPRSDPS
ncbi:GNAT family N-acetyltransferase [Gordonia sp. ABSL11-1]|uniref:GNAT family N-acetyltransferase n=1 Tax=Gordonia sp. ABSL11-1 TaxID=3053924 RepID=UPI00257330EF|nr:GNAT family N-acetyltransferase [Gordonia sp. ABSL11-1]MDL9947366.1 GNAT family N-acetyltransferase [Gordonia sp. ABSL11-1]